MTATIPLTLHGAKVSGHVHRVELLLRMLDLPFEFVHVAAEARAVADFKERLNPYGQIPVLEDGQTVIADSAAILVYLSKRYDRQGRWLPEDPVSAAAVQRWLSLAAGEIAFGPASLRAMHLFKKSVDSERATATATRVLQFMEAHLATHQFLAAGTPTIADLACYSYVAHAPEGGLSLAPYAAVRGWLQRVEALPGFVPMPDSPLPAAT